MFPLSKISYLHIIYIYSQSFCKAQVEPEIEANKNAKNREVKTTIFQFYYGETSLR